jgi:methylenetetrahydrofolate reductase (NADPH)
MSKKLAAGANYIITQLGFDARKFEELIRIQKQMGCSVPTLASLYVLTPGAARMMNLGKVPGCVVTDDLLKKLNLEWQNKAEGRLAAMERAARLGVVLKGLGYHGVHIGGLHQSFDRVAWILDRMETIEDRWREFLPEFNYAPRHGYYVYPHPSASSDQRAKQQQTNYPIPRLEKLLFCSMQKMHDRIFSFDSAYRSWLQPLAGRLDKNRFGRALVHLMEHPLKILFFSCQRCGDCGIQHLAFQCPESGCPKHTRNGACGGSLNGQCEVRPQQLCVWVRAYRRWSSMGQAREMFSDVVPPRRWELNQSSSWLNFHLGRDHQTASTEITRFCGPVTCHLDAE